MMISFIACSSDGEKDTDGAKDTAKEQQTVIVTDENGETSIIEVTLPEQSGENGTGEVPEAPSTPDEVTDGKESEKPDESSPFSEYVPESEEPIETVYPVDKNPIDELEAMALIEAAYNKMNTLSSYEYVAVTKVNALEEEMAYTVNTVFKETKDGIQYLNEIFNGKDLTEGIYHKNGYTYQTIDGVPFKGKMTADEFKDYLLEIGMNTSEYVSAFNTMKTQKTEKGAVVTLSDLDISKIDDFSMEDLKDLGADVKIKTAEGKIVIDKEGHILNESVAIDLSVSIMGMTQQVVVSVDTEVKNIESVDKVKFPSFDGYKETSSIAGLYRLTKASEMYDAMMSTGMAYEIGTNIKISGAADITEILDGECKYSYQTSLLTSKLIMDMSAEGSYNGEPMSMTAVSDGKNFTMMLNGEGGTTKYNEDIVLELLSEMLEYTLGFASCIDDISEKKQGNNRIYEYTVLEDYGYYFLERALSCFETEIDIEQIADVKFESINCQSVLDKNGELVDFTNLAVFSFTMADGSVYNVDYKVHIKVNS